MDTKRDPIGWPSRGLLSAAAALLLALAPAPSPVRAGPLLDRARAVAARTAAQRALVQPGAGTLKAASIEARSQAFQLRRDAILNSEAFRRQEAFYAKAMQQGMTRVPRPGFLEYLMVPDASGMLPESTTISYLQWRRSLNPARFDRFHPMMAPILEQDRVVRSELPIPLPTIPPPTSPEVPIIPPVDPVNPTGPILGSPPTSPQLPVPEPGALAVWAALGLGGALALRRRRRLGS